jgi:predicted Zn-dependent peptidase
VQAELASISSALPAVSGTGSLSSEELTAKLDNIAASITSSTQPLTSSLVFECLEQDVPDVLRIVSDIVRCATAIELEVGRSSEIQFLHDLSEIHCACFDMAG